MKIIGERPLNAIMDQLAEVRKVKVKEAYEKASVKCKVGAGGPSKSVPSSAKPTAKKGPSAKLKEDTPSLDDELSPPKPKAKPPARLLVRRHVL